MKRIDFDIIDSTNTYLKNNYQNLDNYTFVSSKIQTNGHGRNSRTWYSNDENLLFSCLIKDEKLINNYKILSILSAYSIIQILNDYGINDLSIKWPNDIYYKDNKLAGILLESVSKTQIDCLIIGIGLNVNQREFNDEYLTTPISMNLILNKKIDIEELKVKIYQNMIDNFNKVDKYDFYNDIKKYDYLKNKSAYALINNQKKLVKILGISDDYSLLIDDEEKIKRIETGEISFHI